jgi:hypothetical protein
MLCRTVTHTNSGKNVSTNDRADRSSMGDQNLRLPVKFRTDRILLTIHFVHGCGVARFPGHLTGRKRLNGLQWHKRCCRPNVGHVSPIRLISIFQIIKRHRNFPWHATKDGLDVLETLSVLRALGRSDYRPSILTDEQLGQ